MALNLNVGYHFKSPAINSLQGSIILSGAMPIHELARRPFAKKNFFAQYPHLQNRLLDPQLYLAELDVHRVPKTCVKLGSYPWFNAGLDEYSSGELSQNDWKKKTAENIADSWVGSAPVNDEDVENAVRSAVDFQIEMGCRYIIFASPLTKDPATSYDIELSWLERGLSYARSLGVDIPIYATVALQDQCLNFAEPQNNALLEMIADQITARNVDGIYLIIEQGSEFDDTRQCGSTRTLQSVLRFVHLMSQLGGTRVFVNSLGPFGLACLAAGASEWATGWYKSLYRVRLADIGGEGRVYPIYWSNSAAADIHLESDFDRLVNNGNLDMIETVTDAATGLHAAARRGIPVARVTEWQYKMGNKIASTDHFLNAVAGFSNELIHLPLSERLERVSAWLDNAAVTAAQLRAVLGGGSKTKLNHVAAWASAFDRYRRDHSL